MSRVLVVGSVAIDSIRTPHGRVDDVIGGSATHFSYAAGTFTDVRLVGVVGEDFPTDFFSVLEERPICTEGLQVKDGESFRWRGAYEGTMDQAETLSVELNLFGEFDPVLPESYRDTPFVFLANGSPKLQAKVLDQVNDPRFTLADTMNLWIETERRALLDLLPRVDALVINDEEIRMLSEESNLVQAANELLDHGLRWVIVKKGEHGALLFGDEGFFACPGFPVEVVRDPTGAGDTFAGGLLGHLARTLDGRGEPTFDELSEAIAYGTVTASFNVEDFSLHRLRSVDLADVERRFEELVSFTRIGRTAEPTGVPAAPVG